MPHHNVYVVELSREVLREPRFVEANPQFRPDRSCLYVGLTGLAPEVRFARHMAGIQASRWVRRYGVRLRPRLYARYNPMEYEEAVFMERELARRLRNRGYAVWQQ